MNNGSNKAVVIALSLACFILVCSTVAFYAMEEGERVKKLTVQKKFDDTLAAKQDLEQKLSAAEIGAVELKGRLKTQEDTIAALTGQIEAEKKANKDVLAKLQARENEIRDMSMRLETARSKEAALLANIDKVNNDYLALKTQVETVSKTKDEEDRKAKEVAEKEGVSLGTIVVNPKAR